MPDLTVVDREVLRVLTRANGLALPPRAIAYNAEGISYHGVKSRLPSLDARGFTEHAPDSPPGYRRVTATGRTVYMGPEFPPRGKRSCVDLQLVE